MQDTLSLIKELASRRKVLMSQQRHILEETRQQKPNPAQLEEFERLDSEIVALGERLDELTDTAEEAKDNAEQRERFAKVIGGGASDGRSSFSRALIASGFDPLEGTRAVSLEAHAVTSPSAPDWRRGGGYISPLGMDKRFLYPRLRQEPSDELSSVLDFRQSARSTTGTVERAIDATTDKAEQNATLAAVTEELVQWAVVISDIPNQLLQSIEALADFIADEGRFRVGQAIDAHVLAQIVAASPPFGDTGTGLIEQLRNGVSAMRAVGADPSLAALNPTDAAALDLATSGSGTPYVFAPRETGSSSPIWGLTIVERAGSDPPYLIDPDLLGILYMGDVRVEADPYTGFGANTTRIRVETHGLFHVRQAEGARRIAAT